MLRLAVVALLAVTAAACAGAGGKATQAQVLNVEIGDAMPSSDDEDAYNTLGDRYWFVAPSVAVRLVRPCADVRLAVRARALLNGRPDRSWPDPYLGAGGAEALGPRPAGFVLRSYEDAYAGAGDSIELTARATCVEEGSLVTATDERRFELPTASCDGGPPKAFDVSGAITVRGDDERTTARLEPGDLVRPGSFVVVGRRGRAVIGAPECNGFSATLSPGTYSTGSYDGSGRALDFVGKRIDAVGDSHAAGFYVEGRGIFIAPVGQPCRDCPVTTPARYGVRSIGSRVVVRVEQASVHVRGGTGRPVRVRAGEQVTAVCPAGQSCRLTTPRLFPPNEPWASPMASGERPIRRVLVTPPGERPRARDLAPPRSTVQASVLPAAGGGREQVVVAWERQVRKGSRARNALVTEQGVLLWQADAGRSVTKWHLVYERRYSWYLQLAFVTGDVTGDGHPDVLLNASQGSGGCGPWRLLATVSGRVREIFVRDTCETRMTIERGRLVIDEPVGPCPNPQGSAHCFGGTRHLEKRWNGSRLVTAHASVECVLPRLDPRRGCRPRT